MYKIQPDILIELSKDGLCGYMTMFESDESDKDLDKDIELIINEIKDILKVGVDDKKIRAMLIKKITNKKTCIANGVDPIHEKDGYIKYNFDIKKKRQPKLLEDGTVDYNELDIINHVKAGDILAVVIQPSGGKNGLKVTGEIIQFKKGKLPYPKFGKNITLNDENGYLVSEKNGHVTLINGKLFVSDIFEVDNVDNGTGNINYDGSLKIRRNLLNNFIIKASGDVQINGLIEGGYVENKGDLIVKRGIQGYKKITAITEGNITTKFIENAEVKSNKNIIAEVIMHSKVSCKDSINVIGKKGLIVGGECKAGKEIRAKNAGSVMNTLTILEVGVDPDLREKHESLTKDIEEMNKNLMKVRKSLTLLERLKKANKLDDYKKVMYDRLVKTEDDIISNIRNLTEEIESINDYIDESSSGIIRISDTVYPGVRIIIGNSSMVVSHELKRCSFHKEKGDIRIGPF